MVYLSDIVKKSVDIVITLNEGKLERNKEFYEDYMPYVRSQIGIMRKDMENDTFGMVVSLKNNSKLTEIYQILSAHVRGKALMEQDTEKRRECNEVAAEFDKIAFELKKHRQSMYNDIIEYNLTEPGQLQELATYM